MNDAHAGLLRGTLFIDGAWAKGTATFSVLDKFSGELVGTAERASKEQVDSAVAAARRSFDAVQLAPYDRYRILMKASELIEARGDSLVDTIVSEAGFPVTDARNEVNRAAQTFIVSAEEAKRLSGEEAMPFVNGVLDAVSKDLAAPNGV